MQHSKVSTPPYTDLAEKVRPAVWLKYFITLYQFPCVCTWLEIHSGQYIMPHEIGQSLFFYLCSGAKSRWCCGTYLCARILQVLSFEGISGRLQQQKEVTLPDLMCAYDGQIYQDWVGDLATRCFTLIVQHRHKVEWQ